MRVSCPECAAEYEFSSSEIPAEGYDAQCTNCSSVFFVGSEDSEKADSKDADRVVTADCPHCTAQYQFHARDIPPGGYDAQCTQCNEVFFVSDESDADGQMVGSPTPAPESRDSTGPDELSDPPEEADGSVSSPAPSPDAVPEDDNDVGVIDTPQLETPPELANPAESAPAATQESVVPEPPLPTEVGVHEAIPRQTAPLPVMPEPLVAEQSQDGSGSVSEESGAFDEDIDPFPRRNPRGKRLAGVALAAVALLSIGYLLWVPAESEEFVAHMAQGRNALKSDTDSEYGIAIGQFDEALALLPEHSEALAFRGLAEILRGANKEERARFLIERGKRLGRKLKRLNGKPKKQVGRLQDEIAELSKESGKLFESGRDSIDSGFTVIARALESDADDPAVLDAISVYYSLSDDKLVESRSMIERSFVSRGIELKDFDWTQSPSPWVSLAMGRVSATLDGAPDKASTVLSAAISNEPRLQRARLQLAQIFVENEQLSKARTAVQDVLSRDRDHARAKLWLQHIQDLTGSNDEVSEPEQKKKPEVRPNTKRKKSRKRRKRKR